MSGGRDPIHVELLRDVRFHAREDGTVYTVHNAAGVTVAEVCVGKEVTRLNFREPLPDGDSDLSGRSQTWRGGGMRVTRDNLAEARRRLALVADIDASAVAPPVPVQLPAHASPTRGELESVFGTAAFRIRNGAIELHLGSGGGLVIDDSFVPPTIWEIRRERDGVETHAFDSSQGTPLCKLPRAMAAEAAGPDESTVSCVACTVRLLAVEIAALPASTDQERAEAVSLHDEIARILRDAGNPWMSTAEIAGAVNAASRYHKRDGTEVTAFQIHGRTRNYPQLFERDGSKVRLRTAQELPAGFQELTDLMNAFAKEFGLDVVVTETGRNYRPVLRERTASATSGVGVYRSSREVEFNLQVFRELDQGSVADDLLERIRSVSGAATNGRMWPTVSCESLVRDWDRTRAEVMEPYFQARARHSDAA